ncbi:MAG: sulfatase family protein [Chitinophagaceae bacterium]
MKKIVCLLLLLPGLMAAAQQKKGKGKSVPNVIIIYADDLGYGDVSCYGARKISTPNIDKLAEQGVRFTNGHCTSATCTPSRYALMTGRYPWRQQGTGVLPGDAALIVPTDKMTLPRVFQQAGYKTAIVGKWHLGLGNAVEKNWNARVSPGPNETGFDYSFIFPATADRVPTVFMENQLVVGLDSADPIEVNYKVKIGNEPTGKDNPELLKMLATPNHGHNQTIVNGIGRIGYMTGGKKARWTDEEISFTFLEKATAFIEQHKDQPFFLYFNATEPHVPRMPATMFKGKSGLGYRGDAILQLDWLVGKLIEKVSTTGLEQHTIIVFSSDNGPVLDDGYLDGAVTELNGHNQLGPLRGGKYSALEGGTRVPFIVKWPAEIKPGVSNALVSQIDLLASFAGMFNLKIPAGDAMDSEDHLQTFLGKTTKGRTVYVEQGGALVLLAGDWKYLPPNNGAPNTNPSLTNIETGNAPYPQLYDLKNDMGEKKNLADQYPEKVKEMDALLKKIKAAQ